MGQRFETVLVTGASSGMGREFAERLLAEGMTVYVAARRADRMGALAGLMAINNVMGEAERLVLNATEGAGFIGIAVALMGRNHPFGVLLAAILFGFLYQGGAELALWTNIPRELIVVIQALVILFTGALDNMVRMPLERLFLALRRKEG